MKFALCSSTVLLLFVTVHALTDEEISKFGNTGECLPAARSTDYESDLCGVITIMEIDNGDNLLIETNSIPDHDILRDYAYRDTYQGDLCMQIKPQEFSLTIPKNPVKMDEPTCVPSVAGVALNGVQLWGMFNPENLATAMPQYAELLAGVPDGVDAARGYFAEPMDVCGGHPGPNDTAVRPLIVVNLSLTSSFYSTIITKYHLMDVVGKLCASLKSFQVSRPEFLELLLMGFRSMDLLMKMALS
jgi:hypothetical protein